MSDKECCHQTVTERCTECPYSGNLTSRAECDATGGAKQVPLIERLASIPATAQLVIEHGSPSLGTSYIPVGVLAREAIAALAASPQAQPEPVAEVLSWTNGSYSRNYQLRWLCDVSQGAKLYASPQPEPQPGMTEVLTKAFSALEEARGNINPDRGFADELEKHIEEVLSVVRAALAPTPAQPGMTSEDGNRWRTVATRVAFNKFPTMPPPEALDKWTPQQLCDWMMSQPVAQPGMTQDALDAAENAIRVMTLACTAGNFPQGSGILHELKNAIAALRASGKGTPT